MQELSNENRMNLSTKDLSSSALSGTWDTNISWHFELSKIQPDLLKCASVGAVALDSEGIFLTKTTRGYWELPGGHIEPGEDLRGALLRELLEEVNFEPINCLYYGFTQVDSATSILNNTTHTEYPNPGYIPHFVCFGSTVASKRGTEIVDVKHVKFSALSDLDLLTIPERGILEVGLASTKDLFKLEDSNKQIIANYLANRNFNFSLFNSFFHV